MILKTTGDIKPYYVQMLLMLFFPGAKFPEDEQPSPDIPVVTVDVISGENSVKCTAVIEYNGERYESSHEEWRDCPDVLKARIVKIAVGIAVYDACTACTGVTPPWGTLTGVRPAKLANEYLASGIPPEGVVELLFDKYSVEPAKAWLAVDVARAENRLITDKVREECSIYAAIPFCPTRCSYCSFVSYTSDRLLASIPDYLTALCEDIKISFAAARHMGQRVSTVYIGGGTPTILTADQLRVLLSTIRECLGDNIPDEFTLEAGRPDTITAEKLAVAKEFGVDRISVNTQTLNEDILRAIGRSSTVEQFYEAFRMARESGIRAVNVDLIAGLPGESAESFARSVDGVVALVPENITVHTFSVKKAAEIRWDENSVYDPYGTVAGEGVAYSQKAVSAAGYLPYYMYRQKNTVGNLENVGYAKAGYEGLYNIYMMEEVQSIFAAGASSVTKLVSRPDTDGKVQIKRIFQPKYPYEYLADRRTADERLSELITEAEAFYREFR